MQDKKQQLELNMEQWTGSKLGKEYAKVVHCHPVYLTSMQSTSCEMPGWMNDMILVFFNNVVSSQFFHSPVSPSSRGSLVPLHFLPLEW